MKCKIVIGANYGDEGKGMITHALTKENIEEGPVLNILYNGGCQRGHTVEYKDGLRHVFKHFGSGTIDGADTYFNKDFILNPVQYVVEYNELRKLNNKFKVYTNRDCRVSTPWDMMLNQMVEKNRDKKRHGSCGWGIFETRKRYETSKWNWSLLEMRCATNDALYTYLESLAKEYLPTMLKEYEVSYEIVQECCAAATSSQTIIKYIEDFRQMCKSLETIHTDDLFKKYCTIIYEGGQGLALSETNKDGFPHLTPSKTGCEVPVSEVSEYTSDIEVCYVTRTYFTRHGAGPLLNECSKEFINKNIEDRTNIHNDFQHSLRFAPFNSKDLVFRVAQDGWLGTTSVHVTHYNYQELSFEESDTLCKFFDNIYLYDNPYGENKWLK